MKYRMDGPYAYSTRMCIYVVYGVCIRTWHGGRLFKSLDL